MTVDNNQLNFVLRTTSQFVVFLLLLLSIMNYFVFVIMFLFVSLL